MPQHVVVIVGGAVAGSEAAAAIARRGAIAIVLDRGATPYGKIDDGLPRWHVKLRAQERAKIDRNLATPGVLFLPRTSLGDDVSLEALRAMEPSAVLLAIGAQRDRPLPVPGIDEYLGRGFAYQNPFVRWFNGLEDAPYEGPHFDTPDGALVVGGGLASVDVAKILSLEPMRHLLRTRGVDVDVETLELRGIDETLAAHAIDEASIGLEGPLLLYRRRIEDMPLVPADELGAIDRTKLERARARIVERLVRKYRVRMAPCLVPVAPLAEGGVLKGLVVRRVEVDAGRAREVAGSEHELRAPLVVSSIGSVPEPIPGIPRDGELYRFANRETGELAGLPGVFALGNVLTGRGNLRDSRKNALEVTTRLLDVYLGTAPTAGIAPSAEARASSTADALADAVTRDTAPTLDAALSRPAPSDPAREALLAWAHARLAMVGSRSSRPLTS